MSTNSRIKIFLNNIKTIVIALVIAITFRTFVYEGYKIPSGSMKPTLLVGDFVLVSKFSYGYSKHSLPFSPNLFSGRILEKPAKRGDIIVFRLPKNPEIYYIKRLVGLPGDKVQMIAGTLYINGVAIEKKASGVFTDIDGRHIPIYIEKITDKRGYYVLDEKDHPLDNTNLFEVPKDHYFFLGDNRDNSIDSRVLSHLGYVHKDYLIGRAEIIFFSTEAKLWQVWKWFTGIKVKRIFNKLSLIKVD